MPVDILLGLQWGDEGKGKIADALTPDYAVVARFQGGANAGHTIYVDDKKFVLHQVPSGAFHEKTTCVIGNGVVLNPILLKQEIDNLEAAGVIIRKRLLISNRAHLILPTHRLLDQVAEAEKGQAKIGSTLRGISPSYQDKFARIGLRVGDVFHSDFDGKVRELTARHRTILEPAGIEADFPSLIAEFLEACTTLRNLTIEATEVYFHAALRRGLSILAEGAQGTLLDVDFGSYPFVTSSNTIAGGACTGLGVPPTSIRKVYGVLKAYCTRVGSGPFPTELHDETGEEIRKAGGEFGATTGRPRRTGWLDLPALRYAVLLNGVTDLVLTKPDVLSGRDSIQLCTHYLDRGTKVNFLPYTVYADLEPVYETLPGWGDLSSATDYSSLPATLQQYISRISADVQVPFRFISTGPGREQLLSQ